ncbi:hypothetical protein EDD17DRAFT_1560540 [Pisolithus thermaeus]|nr:hypothetical protein EDD17DRAFT_1560540 [Pisolithus thermaeus]
MKRFFRILESSLLSRCCSAHNVNVRTMWSVLTGGELVEQQLHCEWPSVRAFIRRPERKKGTERYGIGPSHPGSTQTLLMRILCEFRRSF